MTPKPINALNITIYNTKHTNNTKIHLKCLKCSKRIEPFQKFKICVLLYISKLHNSYLVGFVPFVYFIFTAPGMLICFELGI